VFCSLCFHAAMALSLYRSIAICLLSTSSFIYAQSSAGSGYTGYSLSLEGDPNSVIYETASTPANVSTTFPPPDVYLNATVNVGEIDITVSNLTAKINLDAQVLSLLQFNAGVDLSIDSVSLFIFNVSAKVLLEARLENLVMMINDTLSSLDLNPSLATIGQAVGDVVGNVVDTVTGAAPSTTPLKPRSYEVENNILYSVNDYGGNTHTNRILEQDGSIVDESLDNQGNTYNQQVVGSYLNDMTFNGYNESVVKNGQVVRELEYDYAPFDGLMIVSAIFIDEAGTVLATQVLSESRAGGSSTVGGL
jgi:hypothetical protein